MPTRRGNLARNRMALLGVVSLVVAGCDRDDREIHAIRAPKPTPKVATPGAGGPMGGVGVGASPGAGSGTPANMQGEIPTPPGRGNVAWDVPAGWKDASAGQVMRIATFRAGDDGTIPGGAIEISVTAFPGDVGGLLANVNRWRAQIGLGEVTDSELPKLVRVVKGTHGEVVMVSLRNEADPAAQGLLAAIVQPGDGQSWFVKGVGAPGQLDALRPSLEKFAGSFRLGGASGTTPNGSAMGGAMPPNHPPIPGAGVSPGAGAVPGAVPGAAPGAGVGDSMNAPGAPQVAPSQASGDVAARLGAWTPPAHWARDAQASGVVAGAFNAKNDKGGARVTATSLMGDGGGALSNINRWRQQMGLEPVASMEAQATTRLGSGANQATMVDLADAGGARRMLAAIVTTQASGGVPAQSWYFKLTGAPDAVKAEQEAFAGFVRAVGLGAKE